MRLALLFALPAMLGASAAAAITTAYSVSGALDVGYACASTTAAGACADQANFGLDVPVEINGTLTFDGDASIVDLELTIATASFVGSQDGVVEVVFTSTSFVVEGWSVLQFGNQLFDSQPATGTATTTVTGLDGGASVVQGPTVVADPVDFTSLSCALAGDGGLCGFFVGATRDFSVEIGQGPTSSTDFVFGSNFSLEMTLIPEPGSPAMTLVGLSVVGFVMRRRKGGAERR